MNYQFTLKLSSTLPHVLFHSYCCINIVFAMDRGDTRVNYFQPTLQKFSVGLPRILKLSISVYGTS